MFQFSIRTLFIVMTAFAVLAWVMFAPPAWVGAVVLFGAVLLLLPLNIAGLIYHRGYWRAYFIGTAPWSALTLWYALFFLDGPGRFWPSFYRNDDYLPMKLTLFFFLVFVALSGLTAVGVRWWAIRIQPPDGETRQPW